MAVFTLALGIGAATAIFSVVYATLYEAMPYPKPDQL
jgi:putative ABC transport system permease protein